MNDIFTGYWQLVVRVKNIGAIFWWFTVLWLVAPSYYCSWVLEFIICVLLSSVCYLNRMSYVFLINSQVFAMLCFSLEERTW